MDMKKFFDSYADHWDDDYKEDEPVRAAIASLCGAGRGKRVLDVACGTGIMFNDLLKLGTECIVGVDLSEKMTDIAKLKFKDEPKVRVICCDVGDYGEGGFDAVLIYNAYPHFLDKESLIAHISKLLKHGGRFTIAHGTGRDRINQCHENVPENISSELRPAAEEAENLKKYFDIDILVDTPFCYMISGILKRDEGKEKRV